MNLPPGWAAELVEAGFDAVHWSLIGLPKATDQEILANARSRDAVVLTQDLDFPAILAASGDAKPSVILVRAQDTLTPGLLRHVVAEIRRSEAILDRGAIMSIDFARGRVRLLPLR